MIARADLHIHLDQFDDPVKTAHDANDAGCALLCATTTPKGYLEAQKALCGCSNVRVAAGLHPWWLDGRCGEDDIALLEGLVERERHIGEIGLDFLENHAARHTWELQKAAFLRICAAAGACGGKVLTIHSVHATGTVLEILEATGCLSSCICILHWFSDSADLLWDAIRSGCWFSIGERSLATGKGREYIKLIPRDKLLFETDMPWPGDAEKGFSAIQGSLERAEDKAAPILGADAVAQARLNAEHVLSL